MFNSHFESSYLCCPMQMLYIRKDYPFKPYLKTKLNQPIETFVLVHTGEDLGYQNDPVLYAKYQNRIHNWTLRSDASRKQHTNDERRCGVVKQGSKRIQSEAKSFTLPIHLFLWWSFRDNCERKEGLQHLWLLFLEEQQWNQERGRFRRVTFPN